MSLASFFVDQDLNADTICEVFTEAGILTPNWEKIGNQLGLQLEGQVSAAMFLRGWYSQDCKPSWIKLAKALKDMEEYKHVAKDVEKKQGILIKQCNSCHA